MRIEILDAEGAVINTIEADQVFAEAAYPGRWRVVPEPEAPAVLPDVTPRQLRLAMLHAGLLSQVEAAVEAGPPELGIWWQFSLSFERGHPLVASMAQALGVPSAQVDALWATASTL